MEPRNLRGHLRSLPGFKVLHGLCHSQHARFCQVAGLLLLLLVQVLRASTRSLLDHPNMGRLPADCFHFQVVKLCVQNCDAVAGSYSEPSSWRDGQLLGWACDKGGSCATKVLFPAMTTAAGRQVVWIGTGTEPAISASSPCRSSVMCSIESCCQSVSCTAHCGMAHHGIANRGVQLVAAGQ